MKFKRQSKHISSDDKSSSIRSRSRSRSETDLVDEDDNSVSSSRSASPAVDSTTADCLLNAQTTNVENTDNDSNCTPQPTAAVDSSALSDHCFSNHSVQSNLACLEQMTCSAGSDCVTTSRSAPAPSCVYAFKTHTDDYNVTKTIQAVVNTIEPQPFPESRQDGTMPTERTVLTNQRLHPRYEVGNGNLWLPGENDWSLTAMCENNSTSAATIYYDDARWCDDELTRYTGTCVTSQRIVSASSGASSQQFAPSSSSSYQQHLVGYNSSQDYPNGSTLYPQWPMLTDSNNDVIHLQNSSGHFLVHSGNNERCSRYSSCSDPSYNNINYTMPCYDVGFNAPEYGCLPHNDMSSDYVNQLHATSTQYFGI
jgi:hypothetical protein